MLLYKGYLGTVAYSHSDKVFHGKVNGINGLITFESDTASGLEPAFQYMVDEYLKDCEEEGTQPERPFKGNFNVRIDPSLHRSLYQVSIMQKKSLNKIVEESIEEKVKQLIEKGELIS